MISVLHASTAQYRHSGADSVLTAEYMPELSRGLWWSLAVSAVRHHRGFRRMSLKRTTLVLNSTVL
eukprot:2357-Heterococcus_DN1.PRE.1